MKWFTCLMCSLASMVLFSVSAMAFTPPVAEPGRFMYDTSGKLNESDRNQINQKLLSINSSTKNEIAVLVVDSLDGDSIDDAANATFKKWGVGKKGLDNGVLIMLALGEHKMRIETGKGIEGELTDLQTQDIMNHKMRPLLKANSVAAAINAGIDGVSSTLDSRKDGGTSTTATPAPRSNNACQVAPGSSFSTGGLLFGLGLGAVFFLLVGRFLLRRKHQDDSETLDRYGSLKFDDGDDDDLPTQPTAAQPMTHSHKFEFNNGESKCSCGETVVPASSKGLGWVAEHKARMEMAEKNANFSEPVHNPPSEEELSRNTKPEGLKRVAKNKVLPAIVAGAAAASATAELLAAQRDAARRHAEEEEERKATARRQREDDERRERERREEDDRRRSDDSSSSSSSSSSFDYGSSSSDSGFGGSDSGFGGGDSGGGGSSSDW